MRDRRPSRWQQLQADGSEADRALLVLNEELSWRLERLGTLDPELERYFRRYLATMFVSQDTLALAARLHIAELQLSEPAVSAGPIRPESTDAGGR